jgi:hypothetical protein
MKKRPATVTVLGYLYILVGVLSIAYYGLQFRAHPPALLEGAEICAVRLIAVIAGIFLLRGKDWARWLALAWMGFHVALSLLRPVDMLLMHAAIFLLFAYILLGRDARAYFRPGATPAA